jgi:hypothetical protein
MTNMPRWTSTSPTAIAAANLRSRSIGRWIYKSADEAKRLSAVAKFIWCGINHWNQNIHLPQGLSGDGAACGTSCHV